MFMQTSIEFPHNGTRTSRAAARSVSRQHAQVIRQRIFNFLDDRGLMGATADEIEHALGIPGNTVRPRLVELRTGETPRIYDSGRTRETRSGRPAVIWMAVPS